MGGRRQKPSLAIQSSSRRQGKPRAPGVDHGCPGSTPGASRLEREREIRPAASALSGDRIRFASRRVAARTASSPQVIMRRNCVLLFSAAAVAAVSATNAAVAVEACQNDKTWKTPKGVGCGELTSKKKCKKQTGCKWKKKACKDDKAKSCSKLFKKYDKKKAKGKMKAKDYGKLAKLCETKGAADIEASVGCPASCGTCPTPTPTETPTSAGVGAVVGETTTTAGFEGGGAAKRDPCKKMKTKKRCHKKKNKQGKRKCSWNPRKEKCKLKKKQ